MRSDSAGSALPVSPPTRCDQALSSGHDSIVSGTEVPATSTSSVRLTRPDALSPTRYAKNESGLSSLPVSRTTVPSGWVTALAIEPACVSTVKPAGKVTRTELPGVESVANAQTGNDTSDGPIRTSRDGAPPLSARSKTRRYDAVFPLYRRAARVSWSSV